MKRGPLSAIRQVFHAAGGFVCRVLGPFAGRNWFCFCELETCAVVGQDFAGVDYPGDHRSCRGTDSEGVRPSSELQAG